MKLKRVLLCIVMVLCCLLNTACGASVPPGNIGDEVILSEGDLIAEIVIEGYGTMKFKLFPDIAPQAVDNFQKLCEKKYYDGLKIHCVLKDGFIQGGSLNGDGTGGEALVNTTGYFPNEISSDARHFYGALTYASLNGQNTTQFAIVNSKRLYDLTQYDTAKIKEKAEEYTAKKEGLDNTDPYLEELTYHETRYNALADMISGASKDIIKKYAETTGGLPMMDGSNTVFGQIFEGQDVLDKITEAEVTTNNFGEKSRPVEDIVISSIRVSVYHAPEPEPEPESSSKKKK
ncbi:MAG: peptidylprolyl isomerase [Oscillospiraceae bacterium]|nr:peptidylprolyl isomerase [Oscillospiraceae bacterium]